MEWFLQKQGIKILSMVVASSIGADLPLLFLTHTNIKYRNAVMKAYPNGNYPIFEGRNHMQYQIKHPKGFVEMFRSITEENTLSDIPFLKL